FRGGGGFLQALGVGGLLPWVGYYTQTGSLDLPVWALVPSLLIALAGNQMTAIPDAEQDRRSGKRTLASVHGKRVAMIAALGLCVAGLVAAHVWMGGFGVTLWTVALSGLLLLGAGLVGLVWRRDLPFALLA